MLIPHLPVYQHFQVFDLYHIYVTGSISEVKIKGIDLNLGAEYIDIVGIEPYNTCRESACLNGGICMPANTKFGFQCICKQGFTGDRCQEIGMSCHQGMFIQ